MTTRLWTSLLLLYIGLDLGLTFWQNAQLPLDGDLVSIVAPSPPYGRVLTDPFGWAVLTQNEVYTGTNRFFAHAGMGLFWKHIPLWVQAFTSPINSLYVASSLFTTGLQLALLLLLGAYVRVGVGRARGSWGYWLAVALLVPLFQTQGFYEQMGITNRAFTYTFFYALPATLLLVLLWPFYRAAVARQPLRLPWWRAGLLGLLMVVIAFNGPIATAAVAVLLLGIGLYWGWHRLLRRNPARAVWLSGQALGLLGLLAGLSLYSLYIGRNNSENNHTHTLLELYQLLPQGVYHQLTQEQGLPLLVGMVGLNALLVRLLGPESDARARVLRAMGWVGWFAVVYVLLLPFGGYREYRPLLLRNDSILPVLLGLFYAYGLSTYFLLHELRGRLRLGYGLGLGLALLVFVRADAAPKLLSNNDCERWALDQISRAPEPVVQISRFCNVLSWTPIEDYHNSALNGQLLHHWRVTTTPKQYYNSPH